MTIAIRHLSTCRGFSRRLDYVATSKCTIRVGQISPSSNDIVSKMDQTNHSSTSQIRSTCANEKSVLREQEKKIRKVTIRHRFDRLCVTGTCVRVYIYGNEFDNVVWTTSVDSPGRPPGQLSRVFRKRFSLGCGVCPTYFQKVCAFDLKNNSTYIFDNHCVMDLYNCMEGTEFVPMNYDNCLFFGNFAYVHGVRYEDKDYGEDGIFVTGIKKNVAGFS